MTKEIYDYAKMQIDREVLSITSHLLKSLYSYKNCDLTEERVSTLIRATEVEVKSILESNTYLGFLFLKQMESNENGLQSILQNPFILDRLEDEQIISIIELLKAIRHLTTVQSNTELYHPTGKKSDSYKIQKGTDLSDQNDHFANRYILLESFGDDKYIIRDFGDIVHNKIKDCLNICVINPSHLTMYATSIYLLIKKIDKWLKLTGDEFVIDTKMFRPSKHPAPNKT